MTRAPAILAGVPIEEVRNPYLIAFLDFTGEEKEYSFGLEELFKEATGFDCGPDRVSLPPMPEVSAYIVSSKIYVEDAVKRCKLPITEKEIADVLKEFDEVLFPSQATEALRRASLKGSPLLFRKGEREVPIEFPTLKARLVAEHALPEGIFYIDDSLIHLAGYLPLELYETRDLKLLRVDNYLWQVVYNVRAPPRDDWKLIWDNDKVATVEIVDLEQEAGAHRDNPLRES